jgi:hypothetical protein
MTSYASAEYYLHRLLDVFKGVAIDGAAAVESLPTTDNGPAWATSFGVGGLRVTSADMSGAEVDLTDAPEAGKHLVVTDVIVSVDTDMRVDLKEETWGSVLASFYMAANTTIQITPRGKWRISNPDKKLQGITSAAGNVSILAFYYSES